MKPLLKINLAFLLTAAASLAVIAPMSWKLLASASAGTIEPRSSEHDR